MVTTSYITDATPAVFAAHSINRYDNTEIANDYFTQTTPNVLLGGGGKGVTISAAENVGYVVITDKNGLQTLDTENITHISGQFGSSYMPYEYDGTNNLPHLSEMAISALKVLNNDPDGYFLMVESGRIDHAAHNNDIIRDIYELIEFENTIKKVDEHSNDEDTLIIVTADHETGGLKVLKNNGAGNFPDVSWSTNWHTSQKVDVYGHGSKSDLIDRIKDNTQIYSIMKEAISSCLKNNWQLYN